MNYPRRCVKCGNGFLASYKSRKYCDRCNSKNDHRVRTARRAIHDTQFIGIDGEGVNRPDGSHEYVLLSVGNRSLYNTDGSRITFYDIFPFLWECFLNEPNAAYVGFYLGYDFTCWLRDLPANRAEMLLTEKGIAKRRRTKSGNNHLPFPVRHREWCFDILPMKRLRLWHEDSELRMYICDTGSYFQTSFLNAIAPENWADEPIVSEAEFKTIEIGKKERGGEAIPHGTPIDPVMIEYNVLENDVLSRLMRQYNKGLVDIGVRLRKDQWFGPGQAAQAWLKGINAPKREEFEDSTDIAIRKALRSSYYGGWFEICAHGHVLGSSYGFDINSAYPFIQSGLPCAIHGKWIEGNANGSELSQLPTKSRWTLAHCTVRGSNNHIGAMPHRLSTGHILRPQISRGWYWKFELEAAKKAGLIDTIEVDEWLSYDPCDCPPPFRDLANLYLDRLRVGKNTISGKARRLIYNSTYGKTAQSIGMARYANPFYASAITAECRARILEAIATHPLGASDVLMVATDGLVFRHNHTSLNPLSDKDLGAWSSNIHQNLTLFMPGVYWDDQTREKVRLGNAPTLKSRGVNARALASQIATIDAAFSNPFSGEGHPQFDIPLSFSIISPKQALARGQWHLCGQVDHDTHPDEERRPKRHISSDPTMKRVPALYLDGNLIRSACYTTAFGNLESMPYSKTFGDDEQKLLDEALTPDGTIEMLLPGMLK